VNITVDDWKQYFPYDNIRPQQEDAINFVLDAFLNKKKKFCVLECAVGVGKSAIGITVARFLRASTHLKVNYALGSYVLSTQKVLVSQYTRDFGPKNRNLIREISSASNYTCAYNPTQKCSESKRILKALKEKLQGTEFYNTCKNRCPYTLAKQDFLNADIGVTNFSYFLAETKYAHQLEPRSLVVVDEAHALENTLSSFVEITFSEKFAKDVLNCKFSKRAATQEEVFDWVKKNYKPSLSRKIKALEKQIEIEIAASEDLTVETANSKQFEMLDKHICKINRFIEAYEPDNWVMNVVDVQVGDKKLRRYEFKPVDVSPFCEDYLYKYGTDHVLLMSATIMNKDAYCRSVGINPKDAEFYTAPSPFPIENRQIHVIPVGSMSFKCIDNTLPVLAEAVKMLLERHKDVKGICHCQNYKIATFLRDNLNSDRILLHNSENRDAVLKQHMKSNKPTVLTSPSMTEGIDLFDDNSRFQILCKIPFPYLKDKVTLKRMEKDKEWYAYQTAKTIVQSLGRSVRNEKDFAVSYILDSDWKRFYAQNKHMFPADFVQLLVVE